MDRITTRDLLHRNREIQAELAEGKAFEWTVNGRVIARINPLTASGKAPRPDWAKRAAAAGAIVAGAPSLSSQILQDRD